MRHIALLLALLVALPSYGQSPIIWGPGGKAKSLQPNGIVLGTTGTTLKNDGEKNYIGSPSSATGWTATEVAGAATITATTTTTGADLPREITTANGISIASGDATDYVAYCFTIDDADKSRKLKVQWDQKPSSYATGDFDIEVYSFTAASCGGSATALYNNNGETSTDIPNYEGMFAVSFDTTTADYYGIRFTRRAGTSTLVISDVTVGPGVRSSGAAVTGWRGCTANETPTVNGIPGSVTTGRCFVRRVGESVSLSFEFAPSGAATGNIYFTAGTDIAVNTTDSFGGQNVGSALARDDSAATHYVGTVYYASGGFYVRGPSTADQWDANAPMAAWASGDSIQYEVTYPVLAWDGGGTVNLIQDETLTEWTSYTPAIAGIGTSSTAFFWRRNGDTMDVRGRFVASGAASSTITISIPQTPIAYTIDTTKVSASNDTGLLGTASALDTGVGYYSGSVVYISASSVAIREIQGAADTWGTGGPMATWANGDEVGVKFSVPITQWRGKSVGAVGFALATSTSAGLVNPYSTNGVVYAGTYTPTVTNVVDFSSISVTALSGHYLRVGNQVYVTGRATVTNTDATRHTAFISLPIASTFTSEIDGNGVCAFHNGASADTSRSVGGTIFVDTASSTTQVIAQVWPPSTSAAGTFTWSFSYTIK